MCEYFLVNILQQNSVLKFSFHNMVGSLAPIKTQDNAWLCVLIWPLASAYFGTLLNYCKKLLNSFKLSFCYFPHITSTQDGQNNRNTPAIKQFNTTLTQTAAFKNDHVMESAHLISLGSIHSRHLPAGGDKHMQWWRRVFCTS